MHCHKIINQIISQKHQTASVNMVQCVIAWCGSGYVLLTMLPVRSQEPEYPSLVTDLLSHLEVTQYIDVIEMKYV